MMGGLQVMTCAAALVLGACGGATTGPVADAAADTTSADGLGDDATAGDTTPATGEFELGTNVIGANDPTSFTALGEGDQLEVQLGFQGLWMVVLAFRTRDLFDGQLVLSAELTAGGASQGTLSLAEQRLTAGGDGWLYYYNFFLVVNDPSVAGQVGSVHFVARDDAGHAHDLVRGVMLTGGP